MLVHVSHRMLSIGAFAMLGATGIATLGSGPQLSLRMAGVSADSIAEERAYAGAIATVADSAIHRLDFFPARAQLRVQTAFLIPSSEETVPFDDLAVRGDAASIQIDAAVERLATVRVPSDLHALNTQLVKSLKGATNAAVSLTAAAHSCHVSMASIDRCQVPFSAASSRVAESYKRYIEVRAKIRAQILDTDTRIDDFRRP